MLLLDRDAIKVRCLRYATKIGHLTRSYGYSEACKTWKQVTELIISSTFWRIPRTHLV